MLKSISISIFLLVLLSMSFQIRKDMQTETDLIIQLKWLKSYREESWAKVRTGMLWSFSYLGAKLPRGSFDNSIKFQDSSLFSIDLAQLGFNTKALQILQVICDSIKRTEDYQINHNIDLSRFLILTLHSPQHYYRITGAETNYKKFKNKYNIDNGFAFAVTKSCVGNKHRLLRITKDTNVLNYAFVAEEGNGSLFNKSFVSKEFEVFDVMENGQLRFAIYDKYGILIDAASTQYSRAGKPSKCMWCHESSISPLFTTNIAVKKYLNNESFMVLQKTMQNKLFAYQTSLISDLDFKQKQAHTQAELLYIGFMEASMFRLQQEFKSEINKLDYLKILPTHMYEEFPFLGNLLHRRIIDSCCVNSKIEIPESIREKSKIEPNYFQE